MMKREEIAVNDTWKLEDILVSDEAWEALYTKEKEEIGQYVQFKGRLGESADTLYACLKFDDDCSWKVEILYVYARMRMDQDTTNQRYQEMFARAQSLSCQAAQNASFVLPEILAVPEEKLKVFLSADNGIKHYLRAMEQILAKIFRYSI